MDTSKSFNSYIEQTIRDNWDRDALTDYKGATLQYHDVARKIAKLHIFFEQTGIRPGDKIALCGRNSSMWAVTFLGVLAYGAVAVPIQHEFTPEQVYHIVGHSEARLLFVGDIVATQLQADRMPSLEGIVYLPDYSLILSRNSGLSDARERLNAIYGQKYPKEFTREHIIYFKDQPGDLAMINYTSGTTGFSKGVMLPYRALLGNLDWAFDVFPPNIPKGSNVLSILPMAHMYGMMVEFIFQFAYGSHLFFLTRLPSPSLIAEACQAIRPAIVVSVPLVVEKIVRKKIFPRIQHKPIRLLLGMPGVKKKVKERICQLVSEAFGGRAYQVMVGGAPLNQEIEQFLLCIGFPITMGYGTTETAPMITYSDHRDFRAGSCGTPVKGMEVRILSPDPATVGGELVTRGPNTMLGYYKNAEATREVIDADGWFHTGDLGTMTADGHVYLRGRIKNMLLGANGQNVYPEEIEDKLNSLPMVAESLVIQDGDRLVALIHPDQDEARSLSLSTDDLQGIMEQNRQQLNQQLPPFCRISEVRLHDREFEKTAKKSIKRYLYKK